MNESIVASKNVTDILFCVTFLEPEFSQGALYILKKYTIDRTDDLKAFLTLFSYIKVVYVFTDVVFKHFILEYCAYSLVKLYNMDHSIREYRLLYGRFYLNNPPFLTYDACTKLSQCFWF
jgi:hypothetical protein